MSLKLAPRFKFQTEFEKEEYLPLRIQSLQEEIEFCKREEQPYMHEINKLRTRQYEAGLKLKEALEIQTQRREKILTIENFNHPELAKT